MLLEEVYKIAKKGAEKPLILWSEDYAEIAGSIIPELEEVGTSLEEGTEAKKNVKKLIELLKKKSPNELELAKSLSYISELFDSSVPDENKELISKYVQACKSFYTIAQTYEFYNEKREKMKQQISAEEQKQFDLRLFKHEGMMYCLEYYLAIYKAIQDVKTEAEKRKFIESTEFNLGFGNVPGLWQDFSKDEVLGKFIYSILNDGIREKLTKAYFDCKLVLNKINLCCDKQGKCEAEYQGIAFSEVISEFRNLIVILLQTFQQIGIDHLSSIFFTPYGNKPLIQDIKI